MSEEELPMSVEELDRLRLENAQLRLMNLNSSHKVALANVAALEAEMSKSRAAYAQLLCEMADKYKFDPNSDQMEPDTGKLLRAARNGTVMKP